jgi:hypothetical protein
MVHVEDMQGLKVRTFSRDCIEMGEEDEEAALREVERRVEMRR